MGTQQIQPTSGLDSFVSKQIMTLLNTVAQAGNVVIFTIHQPAYSVFAAFTKVLLLNGGKLMYYGLTSDAPDDFASLGYPVPKNTNPADWILVRQKVGCNSMIQYSLLITLVTPSLCLLITSITGSSPRRSS